jgi:two-component system, OmpR family, response regulator
MMKKELRKILYAEDDTDVQTIVELTMQTMSNFDLKICDNGKKLMECVEEYNPDLIILDVMMPEMDGPSTFRNLQFKETTKDIPVIFMTAKAQAHEVKDFKECGVIGIITKPFDPIKLCHEIAKIWCENFTEKNCDIEQCCAYIENFWK